MDRFWKTFLLAGAPFGLMLGLVNGIKHGWQSGVGSGVTCGAVFGLLLALFVRYQSRKFKDMRPKYEPEGLVLDGGANLGGAGGYLFLTKQRLVFEPHKLNVGAKLVSIPLSDIKEVRPANGALVRRFEVVTSGATHSFLVEKRDQWLEAFTPLLGIRSSAS